MPQTELTIAGRTFRRRTVDTRGALEVDGQYAVPMLLGVDGDLAGVVAYLTIADGKVQLSDKPLPAFEGLTARQLLRETLPEESPE